MSFRRRGSLNTNSHYLNPYSSLPSASLSSSYLLPSSSLSSGPGYLSASPSSWSSLSNSRARSSSYSNLYVPQPAFHYSSTLSSGSLSKTGSSLDLRYGSLGSKRSSHHAEPDFKPYRSKYKDYKEEKDYKKMYEEAIAKMDKMKKEFEEKEQEWRMEQKKQDRVISELEENVKEMESMKGENERLKEENTALVRVISKLSD